jgi:hypothetical protein
MAGERGERHGKWNLEARSWNSKLKKGFTVENAERAEKRIVEMINDK